jgi:hypothetical protein
LSKNPHLNSLSIEGKHCINKYVVELNITADSASQLGNALKSNTGLNVLSLAYNAIGDEAAKNLFSGLELNKSLTNLDLTGKQLATLFPTNRNPNWRKICSCSANFCISSQGIANSHH